ncbi:MAG: tyrosine-type recombinase/integrase, partial [Paludibacteraceae bacterium]|nr:tyrosine-type recombinase/integrase [Paludibacteraceae bacterium]
MIQKFLDYIAIEKRYSARTVGEYGDDLKAWCAFLGWEVKDFDPSKVAAEDVKLWMIEMLDNGQSPRSVKRRLSAVKSFYKFLLRVGLVKVDITRAIVAPKTDKPLPLYFRESEMQGVKINQERDWNEDMSEEEQFTHLRDYLMVEILYQTGMRRAELVGLKEVDVDTRQQQVRVFGKRAKERIVPIGEGLCELIEEYRKNKCSFLGEGAGVGTFLVRKNRKGEWVEMDAHTLYNIVRARMGEVSTLKKHSPHVLRHTFATSMLNNGADIRTIQSLLGHASLAATQVYTHATFEQMKEAYEAAHPRS